MELVRNQTKFTHKTKASWGEGVFRGYEGGYIVIEFVGEGTKKFAPDAIGKLLVPKFEDYITGVQKPANKTQGLGTEGSLIQFDGEPNSFGGKNIISSFESEDSLLFNESYTVVGSALGAKKIHAMYDLTVIGDLNVSECVVNGSLIVLGNINAESLNCANTCFIQGDAIVDRIYVGADFIANSVKSDRFSVDGNAVIRTTIDINSSANIEKTIVACEGIMGAGLFNALNAIANEYFEFDGEVSGKILELETDTTISENTPKSVKEELSLHDLVIEANNIINKEYEKCPDYEEDYVINSLKVVESEFAKGWIKGPNNECLFKKLVDISYKEKIETLEDYLYVLLAKKTLPQVLYEYETVDFVDSLIPFAEKDFEKLSFNPSSIKEFMLAVDMVCQCSDISGIDYDTLFEKVFEAIGLRFNTVKSILIKNERS